MHCEHSGSYQFLLTSTYLLHMLKIYNFLKFILLSQAAVKFDADQYLPTLHCMEKSDDPVKSAEGCLKENLPGINYSKIDKCAKVTFISLPLAATKPTSPTSHPFILPIFSI